MPINKIEKLKMFFKQDKNNLILFSDLVEEFFIQDQLEELVGWIQSLEDDIDLEASMQNRIGLAALIIGDLQYARKLFEAAFSTEGENYNIAYNLAFTLYAQGFFKKSLESIEDFESQWKELPKILLLISRCKHQLGKIDEARMTVDEFINVNPKNEEALGLKALLLLDSGDYHLAKVLSKSVLKNSPLQLESLLAISGSEIAIGRYDDALPWVECGISEHPEVGRFWQNKGQIEMLRMQIENAENSFKTAVQKMPMHIGSWHLLAWTQHLNNKSGEAKKSFKEAMVIDRNFADNHGSLAMMEVFQGNISSAEYHLKRCLKLDPQSATGLYSKSLLLEASGNNEEAEKVIKGIFEGASGREALKLLPFVRQKLAKKAS